MKAALMELDSLNQTRRVRTERAGQLLGGYSPDTLASWRSRGIGPAFLKLGRNVFYEVSELERWVKDNAKVISGS